MPKNSVTDWDETASNNTEIAGIDINEGCAPSGMNNAVRTVMSQVKAFFKSSLFRLRDSTDQTKLLAFDLSGLPTATTTTVTMPAKGGTLALMSDLAAKDTRRNLWVNGSFRDSQENGNTLGTTNGYYPADQIALYFVASTAAMSVQRIQARTLASALDQIEFKTTTAKASLAAGDFVTLTQNIEGSSFAESGFGTANAKPYVHRFQVSLPAGTYHWHFANSAGNRHCAAPFTISAPEANTPVVKEIVVPADTTGTWLTADGVIGIKAELVLAVGSTRVGGTASTWGATPYFAAATQANILSSTSNVARLADVGLNIDPDGDGVYGGAYRVGEKDADYNSQRYVFRVAGSEPFPGMAQYTATNALIWVLPHNEMAKQPTLLGFSTVVHSSANGTFFAVSNMTLAAGGMKASRLALTSSQSGFTAGMSSTVGGSNSTSFLLLSARIE